ncbi:LysM peptidoglycan-binding domain-containing protein [Salinimicrobium gaetbulicola]|uniref:LysM peptidoglycan-binding domain-containing protein n=1 Tax=Salinimicrobium gaetbulicola TaxID=999702 RepID=A0ABW3IDL4_9FLAO
MKQIIVLFLFFQMLTVPVMAQQFKYHIVKRGETTAEIARKYNTTEETIFKYNPDARKGISPNTKLVVPVSGERVSENIKFETHRVKRKETLFSLSQQYNVSIDDIKRYNKHLYSEELRKGERIQIPINLPKTREEQIAENPSLSNPLDLTLKEHVVLPKETLYGISRKYNITIADLQRLNPNLESLQPGMVLKVRNGNVEKVVDVEGDLFKYYMVKPQETLFSLTRRFGISRDSLVTLNPALADGLKSGMVLKIPNKEVPETLEFEAEEIVNLERRLSNFDTKNVAVMLPFNLDKVVKTDTSNNSTERIKKDRVLQISLDFYSGVLMAVDSAKNIGISTRVNTYDTQQSAGKVHAIINSNDFSNTDVVIGPILQSTAEAAASALQFKNVPVISPLTNKQVNSLGNFLQARPTDEMLTQAMISFISENAEGKNLVIIADAASADKKRELMSFFPSAKIVDPKEGSFIDQEELMAALVEGKPNWVILEATKIGVLSNTTSYLNSLVDKYKVTLMTTDKNNSFDSDNISNNHLGKLSFHYPSVDRVYTAENSAFINKYVKKYGVVPNTYAVRGFDVTYDLLLRLASSEDLYSSLNEEGTTQYVENKFNYETKLSGGYQNKAIYIMAYDRDLNLKVVR